ncbi:hypothetical protein FRC08_016818 [Ceratobasidium sp. 394]|nr:hypothetical protein FRC08_016818 [Ceratobasidium sp. 394]
MFEEVQGGIRMVVKLLEDVADGQEICISYTDPASPHSKRRDALEHAYGFSCHCPRCVRDISVAPVSPGNADQLRKRIGSVVEAQIQNGQSSLDVLRNELESLLPFLGVLLECLPDWTAEFSTCSHDGPYDKALDWGNAVLGVYLLVYPGIHPLLELHCLELCKVAWNHYITSVGPDRANSKLVKGAASAYLRSATRLAGMLQKGLEASRMPIAAEYEILESCLREEYVLGDANLFFWHTGLYTVIDTFASGIEKLLGTSFDVVPRGLTTTEDVLRRPLSPDSRLGVFAPSSISTNQRR